MYRARAGIVLHVYEFDTACAPIKEGDLIEMIIEWRVVL